MKITTLKKITLQKKVLDSLKTTVVFIHYISLIPGAIVHLRVLGDAELSIF